MGGGSAPTSSPTIVTPAMRPSGHQWSKSFFDSLGGLPQYPQYGGQVDPGLSPTLQNVMRMGQQYSQSPMPGILGQAMGGLGSMMGGGGMPGGAGFGSLMNFAGGGGAMGPMGNPFGPGSNYGTQGSPLGPGMQQIPGWNPGGPGAQADRGAMGAFAGQQGGGMQSMSGMPGGQNINQAPGGGLQQMLSQLFGGGQTPGGGGPVSMSGQTLGLDRPNQGGIDGSGGTGSPPGVPPGQGVGGEPGDPGGDPRLKPKNNPYPPFDISKIFPGGGPTDNGGLQFKPSFVGWDPSNPNPWMTGSSPSSLYGSSTPPPQFPGAQAPVSMSSPTPQPPPGGGAPINASVGTSPSASPSTFPGSLNGGGAAGSPLGSSAPPPSGQSDPFGPTGAYDVFRNSVPVMNRAIDDSVQQAMGASGLSGNRYSSSAQNTAGQIGADAGLQLNQDLSQRLFDTTQAGLDRQLQASMGAAGLESQGMDRMLRAMGMAPGMASTEDQLMQNRMQLPFQLGQYEQGRQDRYGAMGLDQFNADKMGWFPMLSQLAMSAQGGGVPAQVGSNQTGGQQSGFSQFMQIAGPLIMAGLASDARLKKDITPLEGALGRLRKIKAREFTWRNTIRREPGVVAQEVAEVEPGLAIESLDDQGTMGVSLSGLIGLLIGSVQELAGRVEAIEGV